jgi:hypothetical protein
MSAGLTYATTDHDRERWSLADMYKFVNAESFKTPPPRVVRVSRETLRRVTPLSRPERVTSLFGIPLELDDSLKLFQAVTATEFATKKEGD